MTAQPRTILVTGSSSGFGRVISRGTTLEVIELDVEEDASVDRAVARAVAGGEGIDVLVNNAGGGYLGILEAFSVLLAQELFERNVFSVLRLNRAVLPHMRARGSGLLVHMSSGLARFVLPFNGLYSATKFAVEAIAETFRYELATVGIDSVIVEPGVYATGFFDKATTAGPTDRDRVAEYVELTRLSREMGSRRPAAGDPREVAEAVANLIELPAGSRPLRTTVGWGAQRADGLNAVSEELQQSVLDGLGVREQLTLAAGHQATTAEV